MNNPTSICHPVGLTPTVLRAIAAGPEAAYAYAVHNQLSSLELDALEDVVVQSPRWATRFAQDVCGADVVHLFSAVVEHPFWESEFRRVVRRPKYLTRR